jgi:hypothetical protein
MLATARIHDATMRDLEQELRDMLASRHASTGEPPEGLHVLTRRMENEEEEQFDVDLTILDFLVYKATSLVFEWRSSADPFHSDLPNALVTMTGGAWITHVDSCTHTLANAALRMEDFSLSQTSWPQTDPPGSLSLTTATVLAHLHPSTAAR